MRHPPTIRARSPVSQAAMFATVARRDPAQVQAGHAVDQQRIEPAAARRARDDRDAECDAQRDEQQHDDDDGPLDRQQLRGDEPEPVEHDREGDPPPDRALTCRCPLTRQRLPHDVRREPEVDHRPDAERRRRGREVRALRRQLAALRVLDLRAAEPADADRHGDQREPEGRDHRDLTDRSRGGMPRHPSSAFARSPSCNARRRAAARLTRVTRRQRAPARLSQSAGAIHDL